MRANSRLYSISDDEVRHHTQIFCRVMNIYQSTAKDKRLADFNIREKHSWDEVLQEARFAEQKYNQKAKGLRGIGHRVFRVVGDNAAAANPWLKIFENNDYTSILCGGLKLIFEVQSRDAIQNRF